MAESDCARLWFDHVGLVVPDVMPAIAAFSAAGFAVSDPVELHSDHGPLGQVSAHVAFANFYIEISAPIAGSGNHLEPLLAQGPGTKIAVLGCVDAEAQQAHLRQQGVACGPVQLASRAVRTPTGAQAAHFRWFAIDELLPGIVLAMVEHQTPELVFAAPDFRHPNGANHVEAISLGGLAQPLSALAGEKPENAPEVRSHGEGLVTGIYLNGLAEAFALHDLALLPANSAKGLAN